VYARVLVPLDGSTFAESALPLALAVARRHGATLDLVTVHEPVPSFAYDEWERAAREWSEHYLGDAKRRLAEAFGGDIETTVLGGRVAEAIEERARETGADLVVMATHGRGAFTRAWLGSVADATVRHGPSPVLLVRPERDDTFEVTGERAIGKVLVALDGSTLSEEMLPRATAFGAAFDASFVLGRIVA
jgi:nucleotide-binding universal stress UspA family protein